MSTEELITEIRNGEFAPDSTRSGRLRKLGAKGVADKKLDEVKLESPSDAVEVLNSSDSEEVETHLTTGSSSESGDDCVVAPRKLINTVAVLQGAVLWQHQKLKTLHLMKEGHVNFFLCGRKRSDVLHQVDANQRFDIPQCRQCFRSKALLD